MKEASSELINKTINKVKPIDEAFYKVKNNIPLLDEDMKKIPVLERSYVDNGHFNLLDWAIMYHDLSNIRILLKYIQPSECRKNCLIRLFSGIIQSPENNGLEFCGNTLNLMYAKGKPKSKTSMASGIYLYREETSEKVCALIIHSDKKYETLKSVCLDPYKEYLLTLAWPTAIPENKKYVTIKNEQLRKLITANCEFTQFNKKNIANIIILLILNGCKIPEVLVINPKKTQATRNALLFSSYHNTCYKDALEILRKLYKSGAVLEKSTEEYIISTKTDEPVELRRKSSGSQTFRPK
jgi:hypothetical protein